VWGKPLLLKTPKKEKQSQNTPIPDLESVMAGLEIKIKVPAA
jgi:hypothetical protein